MAYIQKRLKVRQDNKKEYRQILKSYSYKCALCDWNLPYNAPDGKKQYQGGCDLHHITPYSEGGSNEANNLILLCPNCHKLADTGMITREYLRTKLVLNTNTYDKDVLNQVRNIINKRIM